MRFNPFADEDELKLLQGSVGVLPQVSSEASVPEMNPVVKKHLLENVLKRAPATDPAASQMNVNDLGAAPTSPETSYLDEMKDAQARATDRQGNLGWLQAIAGVGDAIAGRSASTSAAAFDKMRDRIQDQEVGGLEQRRKASEIVKGDEKQRREMDPTSQESSLAQSLAAKMVPSKDFSKMSAQQINGLLPGMSKIYDIEQRKLDRQEARDERRFQSGIKMEDKIQGLKTPFGLAHTVDDAKQLKSAFESKKNFDDKLAEMISLREKHSGGAVFNRDDVGRGKQLSKDLLLAYKDMAKLGVLSQSDEKILNAIIPPDPLEYNSPLAAVQGQDPILHKLKAFSNDANRDFDTRVKTRLREGQGYQSQAETSSSNKTISSEVERLDKKTGKTAIFDSATKQFLRYK